MHTGERATLNDGDARDGMHDVCAGERSITRLLDRAMADPVLLGQLATDIVSALHHGGVRVSAADLKRMLGIPGASDRELIEVVRVRTSRAQGASCGCGGGGE